MSEIPVRCDSCGAMSRVPARAVGMMAICPACRREFVVRLPQPVPDVPTVYPTESTPPSSSTLFGLAISALLVPMAWLLVKSLGARPPVFTLGLPLAIALGAMGLGIGVALVKDWSFGLRVKAILTLLALAWGIAATFYFLKAEWVEEIRRDLGLPGGPWLEFKEPAGHYRVMMPGRPRPSNVEIIRGWNLDLQRFAERDNQTFAFAVGCGKPAEGANEVQFFNAARDGTVAAANGTLVSEKQIWLQNRPGREFVLKLGDQATNRTVRVYLVGTEAVVAMAEGAFLPPDAKEVKRFFDSLSLKVGK